MFCRRHQPEKHHLPRVSVSKKAIARARSKALPFFGPLLFKDSLQETLKSALNDFFMSLGNLFWVLLHLFGISTIQMQGILKSLSFITTKYAYESSYKGQSILIPAPISVVLPGAVHKHDPSYKWEFNGSVCKELEVSIKEVSVQIMAASIDVSEILEITRDHLLKTKLPPVGEQLEISAKAFDSMSEEVRCHLEL